MNVPDNATIAVALLSDEPARDEHLRAALTALGASIAYESRASAFDRGALDGSGAQVIIVNLDDGDDPKFDEIYDLLDEDRYRVLINDGGVSSALSGWDQARWMRHLAAKIFGKDEVQPPRPPNAEAVPMLERGDEGGSGVVQSIAAEAPAIVLESAPPALELEPAAPSMPALDPEPPSPAPAVAAAANPQAANPVEEDAFTLELEDAFAPELPVEAPATPELPAADIPSSPLLGDELEVIELSSADAGEDLETIELSTFDETEIPAAPPSLPPTLSLVEEPVEAADEAFGDLDLDFDLDATAPPVQLETPGDSLPSTGDAAEWSIDALLDDVLAPPPVKPDDEVVVDKMSAAEYLAPDAEDMPPPAMPSGSGIKLELMPLEEAVAPVAIEKAAHENWLDPDAAPAAKIRTVWVLGASVGGPESVRAFLGQLPRDYPALFLVAQHLGDEYVETMMRQLSRATTLTVRAPAHGERASHGEVLVVPNAKRLRVDANGVVVLQELSQPSAHRPSIDGVLADVAETFGEGAGAVIFSGMSDDAVAGCKAVAERGGRVYVQSPESCVVSTMVDGVLETGVVQFQGTPEELALKLIQERG